MAMSASTQRRLNVESFTERGTLEYTVLRMVKTPVTQKVVDQLRLGKSILEIDPQEAFIQIERPIYEQMFNSAFHADCKRGLFYFNDIYGKSYVITHGNEDGFLQTSCDTWEAVSIPEDVILISCFMGIVNAKQCLFSAYSEVYDEIVHEKQGVLTVRFYSFDYVSYSCLS